MDGEYNSTPLELEKLCANVISRELWDNNEYIFNNNLKQLDLPDVIKKNVFERYLIIKHIFNYSNKDKI